MRKNSEIRTGFHQLNLAMDMVLFLILVLIAVAAVAGSIACMILALTDLDRNRQLHGFSKLLWGLFIVFSPIAGAVLFYLVVKPEKAAGTENL